MSSFNDVFTGDVVQPTDVSWAEVSLSNSLTLSWPIPRILDMLDTNGSNTITLPPANVASVGQDCLFNNRGLSSVSVLAQDGFTIVGTIPAGDSAYLYLSNNTTLNGQWRWMLFGSVTTQAIASSLSGYGISSLDGITLSQDHQSSSIGLTSYTLTPEDRARLMVFDGSSSSTWTLDSSLVLQGYFFLVRNNGSAPLTLQPNDGKLIDGLASKTLAPDDSCLVVLNDTWNTIGFGQASAMAFSAASLSVSTYTGTQAAADLGWSNQNFITLSGTLSGDLTIEFPAAPNLYVIYDNSDHDGHQMFVTAAGGVLQYELTATQRMVFYTDGGEFRNALDPNPNYLIQLIDNNSMADQSYALAMAVALG